MKVTPAHSHSFTYSASGATITAECANTDGNCDLTTNPTLTIVAPTLTTYKQTGEGISEKATLTSLSDFNEATGKSIAETDVEYAGIGSTSYAVSTEAPTGAGKYTAKITVEGKTASVEYEIAKIENPLVYADAQTVNKTFSTSAQSNYLAAATNGQGSVTYAIQSQKDGSGADVAHFSLDGLSLTIAVGTPAGTYGVVVRATAAGNDNYEGASIDSTVTVTIGKANQDAPPRLRRPARAPTASRSRPSTTASTGWARTARGRTAPPSPG